MKFATSVKGIYNCSLERAFKTPMLCDITKVHTGFWFIPSVTHCTDDENWGEIGGSRKVFNPKTFFYKGGEAALDTVLDRKENEYWKIEISDFKTWMMGFTKFQGEWFTEENDEGKITVTYAYTLFTKYSIAAPIHWLFTKTFWRWYMRHALNNIREMAEAEEPYVFD